jgi:flagellar motility protein MotE (MotC chaperone)
MARAMAVRALARGRETGMARKLKIYQTSLGFFDLAVAAPSMKAALQAWGADRNLFHEGVARPSDDPHVIAATMAKPGVVLKRPVGSSASFQVDAKLPTHLAEGGVKKAGHKSAPAKKKHQQRATDEAADRKAALAFDQAEQRRAREGAKQEAARRKERARRQRAVDKAQAALDAARRKHQKNAADIQAELAALEKRSQAEDARWEKERARLETALRQAQG